MGNHRQGRGLAHHTSAKGLSKRVLNSKTQLNEPNLLTGRPPREDECHVGCDRKEQRKPQYDAVLGTRVAKARQIKKAGSWSGAWVLEPGTLAAC